MAPRAVAQRAVSMALVDRLRCLRSFSAAQAQAQTQTVEAQPDNAARMRAAAVVGYGAQPGPFRNLDGQRYEDGRYAAFQKEIEAFIPTSRHYTDPVRTFAYGTDASFYRLVPKVVVKIHSEDEVKKVLPIARKHKVPVTFRAAGTSLSGQAVTDSVLLKLSHSGRNFRRYEILDQGKRITVEPGLIGGEVNRLLQNYHKKHGTQMQYKIGPDPSSIDSCMLGGIISNNSSGMCCGVKQNTYHTLQDMRIVFADGTVLDTADEGSKNAFLKSHARLVAGVQDLARRVQADEDLAALIRKKFSIKCTTGYSINALVDHPVDDPIEIIKRLMIGSEGTLGFVSRATINTVPDLPNKASAFIMFPHVELACKAAALLRRHTSVDAVEMFDRASLRECEANEDMVKLVKGLVGSGKHAASLLIECRGDGKAAMQQRIDEVLSVLRNSGLEIGSGKGEKLEDYMFSEDEKVTKVFWDVRKGLIPIVGGARETGTSMLIEDVACPVENLGAMTMDLIEMFERHGYKDASCFGHALEGNLHLVFSQGFRNDEEIERYSRMMQELCELVALKHNGSLKAEHGTGRNVAPFVEMEWGSKAYELMWELKELFDPEYVLNPGVILNHDEDVHRKALKPSPPAHEIVDRCIECGFCESNCPSRDLSLTPRQRITVFREISRLRALPNRTADEDARLKEFEEIYVYQGEQTCAADGMCQEKCPVKINTGELIKELRKEDMAKKHEQASKFSMWFAQNFSKFTAVTPAFLHAVNLGHRVLGQTVLSSVSSVLNSWTGHLVPTWNKYMPTGASPLKEPMKPQAPLQAQKVVYVPSCVTRMMGPSTSDPEKASVHEKMLSLFAKGGYEVMYPEGINNLCCGMMFDTRGFKPAAQLKVNELQEALVKASENGKYPIVMDTSPCLKTLKENLTANELKFSLMEPVEFISRFLVDKLDFAKKKQSVTIHVPCSSKKMGMESQMMYIASKCAEQVHPSGIPCCGMAGDRGMRYPELTGSALQHLEVPQGCKDGYSTSRTCEMSLSNHSGVDFRSLVYLVDEATTPKQRT